MSPSDLKRKSNLGLAYSMFSRLSIFAIGLGSTIIMARLLTPREFGIIAMVAVFSGFAAILQDAGLTAATIQAQALTREQRSGAFWLNGCIGAFLSLVLAFFAPLITSFYGEPQLLDVIYVLAIEFWLVSLGMQHLANLRREMRFLSVSVIEFVANVAGVAVGLIWALKDPTVWALVALQLTRTTTKTVLSWSVGTWLPGSPKTISSTKPLLKFAINLTVFKILNYISSNVDKILIGKDWGSLQLGLYNRAQHLMQLPLANFNGPISSVFVPVLSRLQDNAPEYRAYYLRGIRIVAFIGKPVIVVLVVLAEPLITLVLGPKWADATLIFQALGVGAFLGVTNIASGWIYTSLGSTDRQLKFELFSMPIRIIGIWLGSAYGALGVAIAISSTRALLYLPLRIYAFRYTPISIEDFLLAIHRESIASILAGGLVYLLLANASLAITASTVLSILFGMSVFFLSYLVIYSCMPGGWTGLRSLIAEIYGLKKKAN